MHFWVFVCFTELEAMIMSSRSCLADTGCGRLLSMRMRKVYFMACVCLVKTN